MPAGDAPWNRRPRRSSLHLLVRSLGRQAAEGLAPRVSRGLPELLLDPKELVVFGGALPPRWSAGLDLPGIRGHGEIGDGGVLGLAGAMTDHHTVRVLLGQPHHVERLG